jgi:outer membrane receptor for ferrienterochelin and colicin
MPRPLSPRWLTLFLLVVAAATASAQTQITTGVIQGRVTDATGAVVPGAEVEARNLDTNFTRTVVTDGDGRFVFLQLAPGRYVVTVKKAGFATLVQENLILTVGQALALDLVMKVSAVAETVTVSGTTTVDASRTQSSTTLNETTIANTPVLGRKFEDLLTLTPGVAIVQGPDGDEITFNGQRGIFNNISLDGGDYNNGFFGEQVGGQRAAIDITMDAVKEFQVVASGANAEFGRTAGGVVNVITKSGTNDVHGSLFHFQRLESLTSHTSDDKPLKDFHREQFGGTLGGPLQKDKAFFFFALEHINEGLKRDNLSAPLGTCPVGAPTLARDEGLINGNAECQRLALLSFFRTSRNQEEGQPIDHKINNTAALAKVDWLLNPTNNLSLSYTFDYSKNTNQTFDVPTYGNSANGIEGPSKISVANLNLFSTVSTTKLNEFHVTYSRENRPRNAVPSNVPPDTAMGFATTFRFGNPFFLAPSIDEVIWRVQVKDNFSIVRGAHTFKVGGEWLHTVNDQVFRGFFEGRYIFDSVTGFLRYASPAGPGGFGPQTIGCSNGSFVTAPASCPAGSSATGGPLLLYLQGAGLRGPATDAEGASNISNEEFAAFIQDKWQVTPNFTLNYGLRWEAQMMPSTVDPGTTAYGRFLSNPRFPSDGTIPDQKSEFQPRLGFAWDVSGNRKSVLRGSAGVYYARQNMLSQVGSVTTNGLQQQTLFFASFLAPFGVPGPAWPGVLTPTPVPAGQFPDGTGVRVFARDYKNPRIYSANVGYEQELAPDWTGYVDLTWAKGTQLTRFLNYNRSDPVCCDGGPGTGDHFAYNGAPFGPQLGEVMVTNSRGKSLYLGGTVGVRKRFSKGLQLEGNYTLARDKDDDSNERDPFTDRSFNFFDLSKDYALADRDIKHRFNAYAYAELPGGLRGNFRFQARSAQPISPSPRMLNNVDRGRNTLRKDNEFRSFDWRLLRPIRLSNRTELVPIVEMFNTFNSKNNVNPLSTPPLFDFSGFLRLGVGDPRQLQLAVKLLF